jgi:phenylpyruvate tautomerase PptA (4-oxalocrotonate tautomerase family)
MRMSESENKVIGDLTEMVLDKLRAEPTAIQVLVARGSRDRARDRRIP